MASITGDFGILLVEKSKKGESIEQAVVKKLAWFSLEDIQNSPEIIYPIVLSDYLPYILAGNYPEKPLEIDLGKQPK